uniref:cytochrome c oxidase subunit 7C, mitochondrial-like n=1 Tax=Jaculus jaculus TaxID=51337 RepID=UPI001E1B0E91|nr:cytochrome c oxidase subunit 7C, mitochondrial-like [Jaculus jaculus]
MMKCLCDEMKRGQSIWRFTTSMVVVHCGHYDEGPCKTLPFSVENKSRLLAMMAVFFGSGFVALFFIMRHQLHLTDMKNV